MTTTKHIPIEKQSKREQRLFHNTRRGSWNGVNPTTKKPPNPKIYRRPKNKQEFSNCEI